MSAWVDHIDRLLADDEPAVLVSVARTKGSTPRDDGAKMIVTRGAELGTIGGGNLEYKATAVATEMLSSGAPARLEHFPLGPGLGQCCGGQATLHFQRLSAKVDCPWADALRHALGAGEPAVLVTDLHAAPARRLVVTAHKAAGAALAPQGSVVRHARALLTGAASKAPAGHLLYELVTPDTLQIFLFGAGHVGRALISSLSGVPCHITWIDSREDQFPKTVPANARAVVSDAPELEVAEAPSQAFFLVMSHNHALDLKLVEAILRRGDFAYLGLIGSATKRARFETRLRNRGFAETALRRIACPIGLDGIRGKAPGVIAVSVAADILRRHEAQGGVTEIERSA